MVTKSMNSFAKLTNQIKACGKYFRNEKAIVIFIFTHLFVATVLGRFYILAPDEIGYLNTFNNLYGGRFDYPQTVSGWITSPTYLLRIIFFPAKILNLVGVSDILSLRYCTILYSLLAFRMLQLEIRNSQKSRKLEWMFLFFFLIPSVLLWSSIGLRETFIYLSLVLILCGMRRFEKSHAKVYLVLMFIGSFVLLCTKLYLWVCIASTTFLILILLTIKKSYCPGIRPLRNLGGNLIILPLLLFLLTAPSHAISYVKEAASLNKIQNAAERSGDSISTVTQLEQEKTDSTVTQLEQEKTEIQFSGNSTAIAIQDYLSSSTDSLLIKLLEVTGLSEKLSDTTNSFVINQQKPNMLANDSNPYALDTPSMTNPLSLFESVIHFLLGPFPVFNNYGFIMSLLSWESIIWWALFGIVLYRLFFQLRSQKMLYLPQLFFLVFMVFFIILSALVEVNVGTALRHKSVLLIPLLAILLPTEKVRSSH